MTTQYAELGIPEKIKIDKDFQHLHIVRKWFGFKFIFLTLFAIVWDGFLIFWYVTAFLSFAGGAGELLMLLFPLLHVALGIGLTYYVLTGYLNSTVIDVDFNSITVEHGPLPFWGNKQVVSKMIAQLYCKRDDTLGNRGFYNANGYAVHAITVDRRNIKLLSGLDNSEQALFIEQEIESFLKIEDKPVKGEIR
jgi:hypothetical protein